VERIPSIIAYNENSTPTWGPQVQPANKPQITLFKLGLEPRSWDYYGFTEPEDGYSFGEHPELPHKRPVDVTADYLRCIMSFLRDNFFPQIGGQAFLSAQEWRYVVTIPAIWKEEGKVLTRQAVSRATNVGERDIILIKEPEAAALWLTSVYTENLATADYFLLCDAGGRTVVMSRM
jgi:hypothetical protein